MKYFITNHCRAIAKTIIKPDKEFSFLSYLITGKANILIDTLPERAAPMLLEEMEYAMGEKPLDAIIMNHSEEDHSGALPAVLQAYPQTPIYCSENCRKRLLAILPNADYHIVKTGDTIEMGEQRFTFVETPGLHWDDNMVTFWKNEKILFSNDLFGQYAAAEPPIDRDYSLERLLDAAEDYYTNVFSPASLQEKSVINEVEQLPVHIIAPGHGLILKYSVSNILSLYRERIKHETIGISLLSETLLVQESEKSFYKSR